MFPPIVHPNLKEWEIDTFYSSSGKSRFLSLSSNSILKKWEEILSCLPYLSSIVPTFSKYSNSFWTNYSESCCFPNGPNCWFIMRKSNTNYLGATVPFSSFYHIFPRWLIAPSKPKAFSLAFFTHYLNSGMALKSWTPAFK